MIRAILLSTLVALFAAPCFGLDIFDRYRNRNSSHHRNHRRPFVDSRIFDGYNACQPGPDSSYYSPWSAHNTPNHGYRLHSQVVPYGTEGRANLLPVYPGAIQENSNVAPTPSTETIEQHSPPGGEAEHSPTTTFRRPMFRPMIEDVQSQDQFNYSNQPRFLPASNQNQIPMSPAQQHHFNNR